MTHRTRAALIGLWLVSLLGVGTLARGQFRPFEPVDEPLVLTGDDVGFRVECFVGGAPAGRIVIRYMGEWVEPEIDHGSPKPRLLR